MSGFVKMDYKNTLNLPRTDFPMKADLVVREPQRLERWQGSRLYERIQAARVNGAKFVLHDGPPFANGDVHIGNALIKILKDFIVKYHTLRGRRPAGEQQVPVLRARRDQVGAGRRRAHVAGAALRGAPGDRGAQHRLARPD